MASTPTVDPMNWLFIAMMVMIGLALIVITVSRLALRRLAEARETQRQMELDHQKSLLATNVQAQERERERIAGELHDELASRLTVMRLALHRHDPPDPQMLKLVDETLGLARNLSHELYPPLLAEAGLADTLRDFFEPLGPEPNVQVLVFDTSGGQPPSADVQLHLFRIAQETVQNAIKHANASAITLVLHLGRQWTGLHLTDNGQGFDPTNAKAGLGLRSIESRVQVIGARYRMHSQPGKGTRTTILHQP